MTQTVVTNAPQTQQLSPPIFVNGWSSLGLLTPLIFLPHLRLLLGTKIIRNVERLTNFLRSLPLDHARDGRTRQIQQRLDIHVVGRQNKFEQKDLLDIDKFGVPLLDDFCHLSGFERLFDFRHGFRSVVLAEFNDLSEDSSFDVREGDFCDVVVLGILCVNFLGK